MSYRSKQMLIVRRDLKMRKGKIAAQASHASVEAVLKAIVKENRAGQLRTDPEGYAYLDAPEGQESPLTDWFRYGMAKICVYVDSEEELLALEKTAAGAGVTQAILLRVTPGIDPHTYEAVSTGKVDSKFGAAVETGQAMELVKLALAQPHLKLLGLHCHVGSQVFGEDVYQRTIDIMAAFLAEIRDETGAVLEELNKEYVNGAMARGVSERVILWKSVMRSALLTIVTLLALSIGSLLGGTAIVESIFMWDGVGKLAVDAIQMRDYPLIQAYVVWMAIIYVVVNLITDLLYRVLDPKIRLGAEKE